MVWSKLKKRIEDRFADSVRGRVELKATRYRHSHDDEGEADILINREIVWKFCSLTAYLEHWKLQEQFKTTGIETDYLSSYDKAKEILHKQGVFSLDEFMLRMCSYLNLSIEDALSSNDVLFKSLAILDRRVGKRRILGLKDEYMWHPLLKRIYVFRCEAENLNDVKEKTQLIA